MSLDGPFRPVSMIRTFAFSCLIAALLTDKTKTSPVHRCDRFPNDLFSKSDNFAQYYNCSLPKSSPSPGYLGDYVGECNYPQLFSETTRKCEDFEKVSCGKRKEMVFACDYERERCHVDSCRPCVHSYTDCRKLPDGMNAWGDKKWTPMYANCYKGRGTAKKCGIDTPIFSPLTNKCEPLTHVPQRYGGSAPEPFPYNKGISY